MAVQAFEATSEDVLPSPFCGCPPLCVAYKTKFGRMLHEIVGFIAKTEALERYKGAVDLVFTSPPFPLNRKKRYGNLNGDEYMECLLPRSGQRRPYPVEGQLYRNLVAFYNTETESDNRRVLKAYSSAMELLLSSKSYNAGKRPF